MAVMPDQKGFVLIVTLWVMVVLGVMLTNMAYQVRVESVVERWALNQSTLRWAARGAVHTAAAVIREHAADDYHSPYAEWWSDEERFRDQEIGAARVSLLRHSAEKDPPEESADEPEALQPDSVSRYGLDDEESRLNVNVALPSQLTGFAGISTVLAESIVRFRGELQEQQETDSGVSGTAPIAVEPTSGEAEDEATSQLVQGPIRSLSELLEIEGFTEALLYEKREEEAPLETLLTTVSSGKVNVNSASEAVLTAVGFNEGQVNSILAQREESPFTSLESLEQAISDDPERWQRLSRFFDVRSTTFRLLAQASLPGQTRIYHVSATLSTGSSALTFIRWSEY